MYKLLTLITKVALCMLFFASCSPVKNITYFQDASNQIGVNMAATRDIRFLPDDKLSIIVNTKDPLLDALFNLSVAQQTISAGEMGSGQNLVATYTVNSNGEIDFPILGAIQVVGKNRYELCQHIKERLICEKLANDPIVTVEFSGLYISVMGEVNNPGRYNINRDKITITDALSLAGDLTIEGKRENIIVIRMVDNQQVPYMVNLLNMRELYSSPVYYLQQNDLVYVEPNEVRVRESTVNGNNLRSTSFWISITSLLVTLSQLLILTL